jgi:hypothetical protein
LTFQKGVKRVFEKRFFIGIMCLHLCRFFRRLHFNN